MLLSVLKNLKFGQGRPEAVESPATGNAWTLPTLTYERGGRIVAFVTLSRGEALKELTLEILAPLRSQSAGVEVIDLREPEWRQKFEAMSASGIWFAMSSFGAGEFFLGPDRGPTSPWASAGIPFMRLYGDSPAYFPAKHVQLYPNSINCYSQVEHQEFFANWLTPKAPSMTLSMFPLDTIKAESVDVDRKVRGTVVFPKNGNCPDRLMNYWRESLPRAICAALLAVSEEADSCLDDEFQPITGVLKYFADLGIDLSINVRLMCFLVAQIDDYLRRRKSTRIALSLLDLPVTIRGDNWEHVDFTGRRAKYDGDSDYVRTRSLFDESLAILDMSPNTYHGAHDRVLRAAGRYTTFLTNRTGFYTENFPAAQEFTFQFTSESIRECVERALSSPRETVAMGLYQAARMREVLTVDRYVDQITTVVDACALACGDRPAGTQEFVSYDPI